jgi:16S rRNA processing protein RimM
MSARAQLRSPLRSSQDRVCLGRVGGARGLKGEVRIRAFTGRARDIAAYGPLTDGSGTRSFAVSVVAETEGGVIARLSGIADRTAAERIKGLDLYVPRAALPELPAGEFYQADLLGLAAEDTKGRSLGRVGAIHDFGAGAILEIEDAGKEGGKGRSEIWPAVAIASVDLNAGKVVLERTEEFVAEEKPRRERAKHFSPGGRDRAGSSVLAGAAAGRKSRKTGSA